MIWIKEIGSSTAKDGWHDDFPLAHELPDAIEIDCSQLEMPIHPMFAIRLRVFTDGHREQGRRVEIRPPADPAANRVFCAMSIDPRSIGSRKSTLSCQ